MVTPETLVSEPTDVISPYQRLKVALYQTTKHHQNGSLFANVNNIQANELICVMKNGNIDRW